MRFFEPGRLFSFSLLALATASACTGDIGDTEPEGETEAPLCAKQVTPGTLPVRRLTRFEYDNTVRDLLGDGTEPASVMPAEEEPFGFSNDAASLNVTPVLAEKYMLVAEDVSKRAVADLEGLTGCAIDGDQDELETCAMAFIETFARRAFRRPITADEYDALAAIYVSAREIYAEDPEPIATSHREGVAMVIEATLQSPAFLYRIELGEGLSPVDAKREIMPVSSLEMASRLSYFLWGSMPDEELLDLGEQGKLATKEQVAAQARRMLDDDKAKEAVARFHQEWLDYDRVSNVTKDETIFPDWSPAIAELMKEEMRTFVSNVVFSGAGDFTTLMTAPYTYADHDLAAFYGKSVDGDQFVRVDFDGAQHAGILSMGALLSYYAHTNQTSPVHRGKLVREQILCDMLAPPPANVMFQLPEPSPDSTTRERFSQHSTDPSCAGCHKMMDPIGFGFEGFDAVGRYRSEDGGEPVDASGSLTGTDIDGDFDGVTDLANKLAASEDVKSCYTKMWFRYVSGRSETKDDECSLDQIGEAFAGSGGNVKELLVALTQTDAFMFRAASASNEEAP